MTLGIILAGIVALTNVWGTVSVDTLGARVVSYVPAGSEEVFAHLADGSGGMPLCWPYFANVGHPEGRRHGEARYREFAMVARKDSEKTSTLQLELEAAELDLQVRVELAEQLAVTMKTTNRSAVTQTVTSAFHPYFAVADSRQCEVTGEIGAAYYLHDRVTGRKLEFTSAGDKQMKVWNPGPNPPSASRGKITSQLQPGEWRHFLCVENGNLTAADAVSIVPGASAELSRTIRELVPKSEVKK